MFFSDDNGFTWSQHQKLLASDGAVGDEYGLAVAMHRGIIVVGAHWDNNAKGGDAGIGV